MSTVSNWLLSTTATNLQYDVYTDIHQEDDRNHLENLSIEKLIKTFNVTMLLPDKRDKAKLLWDYSDVTTITGITK